MDKKVSKKKFDLSLILKRFLILGLAVYICISLISQQFSLFRQGKLEKELVDQTAEAKKISKELEDEKQLVGTDEYIERVARERLGFTKKNEKVFVDINK